MNMPTAVKTCLRKVAVAAALMASSAEAAEFTSEYDFSTNSLRCTSLQQKEYNPFDVSESSEFDHIWGDHETIMVKPLSNLGKLTYYLVHNPATGHWALVVTGRKEISGKVFYNACVLDEGDSSEDIVNWR